MKIAAAQISCAVGDPETNLRKIRAFAAEAMRAGAAWVVFPEMSDTGYVMSAIREHASLWSEGPVLQLQTFAQELSLGIICGVSERTDDDIFNTQIVIDATGAIAAKYRKTHLFAPAPIEEDKCITAGDEIVSASLGKWRAGLSICYDLRFPEIYRTQALEHSTDLFIVSAAWPFPRVEHLRTLVNARAIENQSYLILANRVGIDDGVTFCGNSAIIDSLGNVLASGSADREELIVAEISTEVLRATRKRMPVFRHRRPEIYRKIKASTSWAASA